MYMCNYCICKLYSFLKAIKNNCFRVSHFLGTRLIGIHCLSMHIVKNHGHTAITCYCCRCRSSPPIMHTLPLMETIMFCCMVHNIKTIFLNHLLDTSWRKNILHITNSLFDFLAIILQANENKNVPFL